MCGTVQAMSNSPTDLDTILTRGVVETIGDDVLRSRLRAGEKLRIKLGIDPTSPHVHIGRAVQLLKLRDFQQAGHTVVFIVGDFTGVIGDTSDKDSERPMLDREQIEANKSTYFAQVGKVLDLSLVETHENSAWLANLTYREIGEHADCFSVADFIARDNIKRRLDAGKRVSLREVLYPLMQGYDSVAVRADVELGGTDQRFNLLAGRVLQERLGQGAQSILMGPLINGLDGRKMSSSWGNTINLTDSPEDMYGKVMSLRDELIPNYYEYCTRVSMEDVVAVCDGLAANTLHPRDAKMRLARELVTLYHGADAAVGAEQHFVQTFQERGIPDDIPSVSVIAGSALVDTLLKAGMVASKSEWRRLVDGGAVEVVGDGARVTDPSLVVDHAITLKIGKRRFVQLLVE